MRFNILELWGFIAHLKNHIKNLQHQFGLKTNEKINELPQKCFRIHPKLSDTPVLCWTNFATYFWVDNYGSRLGRVSHRVEGIWRVISLSLLSFSCFTAVCRRSGAHAGAKIHATHSPFSARPKEICHNTDEYYILCDDGEGFGGGGILDTKAVFVVHFVRILNPTQRVLQLVNRTDSEPEQRVI